MKRNFLIGSAVISGFALLAVTSANTTAMAGEGCCASKKQTAQVSLAAYGGDRTIVDTAVAAGQFNTLAAALKAGDLIHTLQSEGPFTVFAPTDAAFEKLAPDTVKHLLKPENKSTLQAILKLHVVPGNVPASQVVQAASLDTANGQRIDVSMSEGVMIENANIVKTDIECSNGIIHVIDTVLLPAEKDIVETAAAAGSFQTLLAAAEAAGLVGALQGKGPLTILAPTDEAFAALPAGTVESLLKPENRHKLADILKYHVVSGRVYADQAVGAARAETLEGSTIGFTINDGRLMVNGSKVVATDIDASNGVVHIIDRVLIPVQ